MRVTYETPVDGARGGLRASAAVAWGLRADLHARPERTVTVNHRRAEMIYPLSTTTCMTDVASHRLTYSRRYGFPLCRAPRTEDGQLVPAGLLTHGSGVFSDLPDDLKLEIVSG